MRAVAAFQDATDLVDEAAGVRLGLNRSDLRCLGILGRVGAMTAGDLARAAGLTPGAITGVVDRLVKAGYAHRTRDVGDRRRVTIDTTPAARRVTEEIWGPIGSEAQRRLARRTVEELTLIRDFLTDGAAMQARHARRVADRQQRLRARRSGPAP
jgi:DNA-binding MarR family transcriptional regulator